MVQRQGFFLSQLLDVQAEDLWEGLYSLIWGKPDSEEMVKMKMKMGMVKTASVGEAENCFNSGNRWHMGLP